MENMTKAQLHEICNRKNITFSAKTTKAELITLIEQANKPAKKGKETKGEY